MTNFRRRLSALSMELPSRDVGSRGEELASEALADELYNLGLQTDIDGFTCPGNLRVSRSVYFALEFLAALICLMAPGLRLLALIMAIAGCALLYMSYTRVDPLGSIISKYDSQNVVARYIPQGLSSSSRRGKVIITAYYDVQKPSLFQMPAIRRFYPIVRQVVMYAALAVPVLILISMFPFPEGVSTFFAVVAFIGGIVMLIAIIDQLIGSFLKTPKGANNNASGLAVMTALAEKIVTAEVMDPSERAERREADEDEPRERHEERSSRRGRRGRAQREGREGSEGREGHARREAREGREDHARREDAGERDHSEDRPRSARQRQRKPGKYDSEMARTAALAQERAEAADITKNSTAPIPVEPASAVEGTQPATQPAAQVLAGAAAPDARQAAGEAARPEAMASAGAEARLAAQPKVVEPAPTDAPAKVEHEPVKQPAEPQSKAESAPSQPGAPQAQPAAKAVPAPAQQAAQPAQATQTAPAQQAAQPAQAAQPQPQPKAAASAASPSIRGRYATSQPSSSSATQQTRADAASGKKMPSWWSKVEDEKDRGEISPRVGGEATLRSRFADAPAYHEVAAPAPAPEPAPAPVAEPVSEPVLEPAVAEEAPAAQQAPQPAPQQDAFVFEPAPIAAPPVFEPAPASTAPAPAAEAPVAEPVSFVPSEAQDPVQAQEAVPSFASVSAEAQAVADGDPDATMPYIPLPIDQELSAEAANAVVEGLPAEGVDVAGEPEPAPVLEEPLVEPESEPDWPSGSYKYSRDLYSSAEPDRIQDPDSSMDYQPDISDYSRNNYMYDPERDYSGLEAAEDANPDRTLANAEIPSWLDAANATSDLSIPELSFDDVPAPPAPFDDDLDDWADDGYQPPQPTGSTGVPSLLDLPLVGGLDSNVSIGDGATQQGLDLSGISANDSFIARADVEESPNNLTGSFAPLSATGTMKPVTTEMLEQYNEGESIYLDDLDVDDSGFENQYTDEGSYVGAMPVEMPKKSRFSLFKRKKKDKKRRGEEESSASEWLGLDEEFDARSEGANIGSWDNFDEDDSDWRGGAYGGQNAERNRDAIAALSDDLLNKEVWFVALGASGAGSYGMRNLLKTRSSDVKHSRIINLESIGAGDLYFTTSESAMVGRKRVDPRLHKLVQKASRSARVHIDPLDLSWKSTEATPALEKGMRAITITAADGNVTPGWRWKDDTEEIVDPQNLEETYRLLIEIIKAV